MKYANMYFDGNRKGSVNIGDDLQLVAIDNMYRVMGVPKEEIVRIGLSELSHYNGEYCILPVSFPMYGYREETYITMFSSKIIPVFLALSIMSGNILQEECDYLRHFEPIGCRDYHTVKLLRKRGILAYLNGCMTATLPRRTDLNGTKTYLVDIPQDYYSYIPDYIKENAVVTSQVLHSCDNPEEEIKKRLDEYASNASLIITTRLHCALPCVAMGLPVVLMKEHYSFRFPTISRYIHPYERKEFSEIDWNPKPVEFESIKKAILDAAIRRIHEAYNKYADIYNISMYYENHNIRDDYYIEHVDNIIEEIETLFGTGRKIRYSIWGITQKADMICDFVEKNYKNATLTVVYDQSKKCGFHGVNSTQNAEEMITHSDFVFVTAATANEPAIVFFREHGFKNFSISTDGIDMMT